VMAAWMLSKRDSKTSSAHTVFVKTYTDMQSYRHYFVRYISLLRQWETNPGSIPAYPLPYDPAMELKLKESDLNTDCLMLGLVFDRKADKAGKAIQNLIYLSNVFTTRPLPELEACFDNLERLIKLITVEIKALNSSLPYDDF